MRSPYLDEHRMVPPALKMECGMPFASSGRSMTNLLKGPLYIGNFLLVAYLVFTAVTTQASLPCEISVQGPQVDWDGLYRKLDLHPERSYNPQFMQLLLDRHRLFTEGQIATLQGRKKALAIQRINGLTIGLPRRRKADTDGLVTPTDANIHINQKVVGTLQALEIFTHELDHVIVVVEYPFGHLHLVRTQFVIETVPSLPREVTV